MTTFAAITAVQTLVGDVPDADLVLVLGVAAVACAVAVCVRYSRRPRQLRASRGHSAK